MDRCPRCERKTKFNFKEILLHNFSKEGYLRCPNCGNKLFRPSKEYLIILGFILLIPFLYLGEYEIIEFGSKGILIILSLIIINIVIFILLFAFISYLFSIKTNRWKSEIIK